MDEHHPPHTRGGSATLLTGATIVTPMSFTDFGDVAYLILWLFIIYSFAGVVVETFYCWAVEHKGIIESRFGILYLPLNPLYGIGGVAVSLLLIDYVSNPLLVFAVGLVVCTALEYVTSLVMEKVFKSVFWDYSDKPLNIHGRVCLQFAIYWGLLSLVLIYVLDVANVIVILQFPRPASEAVLAVLCVLTALSIILTLLAYRRTEQKNRYLTAKKAGQDASLPNPWWGRLVDRLVPDTILINTFPRMSVVTEYQQLTGHYRKTWRLDLHLGKTSHLRDAAKQREQAVISATGGATPRKKAVA